MQADECLIGRTKLRMLDPVVSLREKKTKRMYLVLSPTCVGMLRTCPPPTF